MERKIISLPCTAKVGGDSFVQVMAAEISGSKNKLVLEVEVMNLHSRKLTGLDYEVIFYNSILEQLNIEPYTVNEKSFVVNSEEIASLGKLSIVSDFSDARKAEITLLKGYFEDGDILDLKYESFESVELGVLDKKQKSILKSRAGEDAISLAQSNDLSWRCVCGYFNDKTSSVCGNCERSKVEVLDKYSSADIFTQGKNQVDIIDNGFDEQFENEEKNKPKKAKKEKKTKVKKEKPNLIVHKVKEIVAKFNSMDKKEKMLLSGSFVLLLMSIILWIIF